jgi:hypothetical protein
VKMRGWSRSSLKSDDDCSVRDRSRRACAFSHHGIRSRTTSIAFESIADGV